MPANKTTPAKKTKAIKILVVEDERALNDMYRMWLESRGFDVVTADNGLSGIERALHDAPDLIVLDVLLPKKDGFEVLAELRGNPKTQNVPVVILSSLDQDFEQQRGLNLGAAQYLVKTDVSPDILFDTISKLLK